jgi:hypothetical protein
MYLMEVEEYVYLKYYEMRSLLEDKELHRIQGSPLVLVYSSQFTTEFLVDFLSYIFPYVSKIVLEKNNTHVIVCDKYKKECSEPFESVSDVSDDFKNDISLIAAFCCQK